MTRGINPYTMIWDSPLMWETTMAHKEKIVIPLKVNGPGAGSSWVVARMKACGDGDWVDGESGRRPSSGCDLAPHDCADIRLCRSLRRIFGLLPYSDELKER
jgi:hypothetical protein